MSITRTLLEFLDVPATASWELTPEEALDFLKTKGLAQSFDYRDLIGEEHARAFTVAKMMDADLLADVKASLDDAIASGVPFQQWADELTPLLQAKGWWGRKQVTDPLTGETIVASLGSPSRLQTIYRTNMQASYSAGAWDSIQANKDLAPYLLYDAVDDFRTRPEHHAWDGTVLHADDSWWDTHYPPNGWNCRCSVIQLSEDELADLGLAPSQKPAGGTYSWQNPRTGKTQQVPKGIDPGWNYNVGQARAQLLAKTISDKLKGYPPGFAHAAKAGLEAAKDAGAAAAKAETTVAAGGASAATMKAVERSAQWQLEQALQSKTPYLAKSIKDLQKTKAGAALGPAELLAKAKVQAEKLNQQTALSDWKKAYLAGKPAPAKAQAVFDALPEDAAKALTAQLDVVKAEAAAQAAANEQLASILAAPGKTLEAKALDKVLADPLTAALKPTEQLAKVQADVAAAKAAQVTGQLKAAAKKNLVAGKQLTPAQQELIASMPPAEVDAFMDEVGKAIDAATPPPPPVASAVADAETVAAPTALNPDKLVQIGPQRGSNPGGLYRDTDTGEQWYIKTPPSAEHARNEVLAARLYQLAGADVPELRLTVLNGQPAVASRIVDDLVKAKTGKALAKVAGAQDYFAVDAWLANWDVAGASFDNLLVKGGKAVRVDTGGALRFRAQGGLKGKAWGDTVAELDSLRASSTNPQTATVFGSMTREQLQDSARRLLNVDRAKVDALVDEFGPADMAERVALKATLRARLDNIAHQLDLDTAPPVAPPAPPLRPGGKTITAADFDRVTESRANGYTLSTDGGDVEDHQVLLQHYTGADGVKRTRLVAKLRGEGAARAERLAGAHAAEDGPVIDLGLAREKALALAKSINSRAAKGAAWDATLDTRVKDWIIARSQVLERSEALDLDSHASIRALNDTAEKIRQWVVRNGAGRPVGAIEQLDVAAMADVKVVRKAKAVEDAPGKLHWTSERSFTYRVAKMERAHMVETAETQHLPSVDRVLIGEGDGVRVRFIPEDTRNSISSRGLIHVDVDGADLAAAERAVATLADLGVTTTRTTQGERLGLYLDKLGNLRGLKDAKLRAAWEKLDAIADETERNAAKLAKLNQVVGYDLTKSPYWNPDGTYQAFGHGRTLQLRPDLDTPEMARFEAQNTVYTNVTGLGIGAGSDQWERLLSAIDGGGILSSQMERARRGLRSTGSSVASDHRSGGANYVFTRLLPKSTNVAGVYFKPRILRRVDAFSYDGDRYGSVELDVQRKHRAVDATGFDRNAGKGGNETNFRDGISLFDDLEKIVFRTKAEALQAIADMKARGYATWPDGRELAAVLLGPR